MIFYLDKDLAKQGIAKCIAVSEALIDNQELEERKEYFKVNEVLLYKGNDIPHKFKYNETLDNIEEFIEKEPPILSEQVTEQKSDFDESIEIDAEKQYFYIDKEFADKCFKSQIIAVFQQPLRNPNQYFNKEVYQYYGKDIPYYITIDKGTIKEATDYEKYKRKQKNLEENEAVLESKKEIIVLENGQYVKNDEVISVPCPAEYLKSKWDKVTNTWTDLTTDLDRVEAQYSEYVGMDTPSTLKEMQMQDPALADELINMLIELRGMIYSLQSQNEATGFAQLHIPTPSQNLINFKNKFNSIK